MNCKDIQLDLALYADNVLSENEHALLSEHLDRCPLCRGTLAEFREIRVQMGAVSRPAMSAAALSNLRSAVAVRTQPRDPASILRPLFQPRSWRQMWLMPYSMGAAATFVIGIGFLWALTLSANRSLNDTFAGGSRSSRSTIMVAEASSSKGTPSAAEYARARQAVADESPSLNPQGALVLLSESLVGREVGDDEVVVVADVYQNGKAEIAQVVEPSHNRFAVNELEQALNSESGQEPFVPARMDGRADTVRVVLKIQSVDVSMSENPRRRRTTRL